jgi:hypothetical protein
MASEPEDSPGRLATIALAMCYLAVFWSWLPLPRRLVATLARSRYRREATRRSRRMYTILLPIAIAGLVGALLLRAALRSSMKAPRQPPAATRSW